MPSLRLISLYCEETEDSSGTDEAYLTVNGQQVGGINSINNRESRALTYISPIAFSNSAEIRLFGEDTGIFDDDDALGTLTAVSQQASTTRGQERKNEYQIKLFLIKWV